MIVIIEHSKNGFSNIQKIRRVKMVNIQKYHLDINTYAVATEPKRNYYIPRPVNSPFSIEKDSQSVMLLNGEWFFGFFDCFEEIDFENLKDKISVPSNWQYYSYDFVQYTNILYPFPYNPPYVSLKNYFGAYKKLINIEKESNFDYFINFEGVDSAIYLLVNDEFVGYDQVSHSTKEWNISKHLKTGENTICAVVPKWCTGSYLEDQDKIRLSGIFRDVYILKRPKQHIKSYFIKYNIDFENNKADLNIKFEQTADFEKIINIYYKKQLIFSKEFENSEINFSLCNIKLWNAEQPELYDIEFITKDEKICDYIGFRHIEIADGVFKINQTPVKIKGVNRHDSYYDTGYYAPIEYIIKDLDMMKNHNINAIRTSHYPPTPQMLYLCDKMGFYVIDEADLETHGVVCSKGSYDTNYFDLIADDPVWNKQILDRVQRLVYRDFNRSCVIMWSLGNESGWGSNMVDAANWVEGFDSSRVVHYEGLYIAKGKDSNGFKPLKMMSKMYPSIENIKEYLLDPNETRPLMLCEFSHSMGNSCGDLKDYFDLFYSQKRLIGGLVWEWNDHSFPINMDYDKPGYGGDWGDIQNDGNFCLDGLVNYKREPSTNLKELKNVICPIDVQLENKKIKIINRYDFTVIDKDFVINYQVFDNSGKVLSKGKINIDNLAPQQVSDCSLDLDRFFEIDNTYLLLEFYKKDFNLGHRQFALGKFSPKIIEYVNDKLHFDQTPKEIIIKGKDFLYVYDKTQAVFSNITRDGRTLINDIQYNIWRAPIDNDRNVLWKLKNKKLDRAYSQSYKTQIEQKDCLIINSDLFIVADSVAPIMAGEIMWQIDGNGNITAKLKAVIDKDIEYLPRFGLKIQLSQDFDKCSYFGYGLDSYIDKHNHTYKTLYNTEIKDMFVNYHKPQENGAHYDTDYINILSEQDAVSIICDKTFSFNLSYYSQQEIEQAKHFYELNPQKNPILCIDYMMSGIGSNSCGPELAPQYKLIQKYINMEINFVFTSKK